MLPFSAPTFLALIAKTVNEPAPLPSQVNPSVEIREGFETYLVTTQDGRALTGFLVERDNPDAVLGVNIQRLDLDAYGSLVLTAQAAVEFHRPTRSASMSYNIVKAPPVRGVAGQVAAASEAVGELTDGLAGLLQ